VLGRNKLIIEPKADVVYRFDLESDPHEEENHYDPNDELDRMLMRHLIDFNPSLVVEELEDPDTFALLEQRLDETEGDSPGAALPFLLSVAALRPSESTITAAARIFKDTDDSRVRLLVLRHMFGSRPKGFDKLLGRWLEEIAASDTELQVVAALARQGQPPAAGSQVVERMKYWGEHGAPEEWEPYLMLVRRWHKSARYFADALASMLDRADVRGAPPRIYELLLENVASLTISPQDDVERLLRACRALLENPEPRVRAAAMRALSGLSDESIVAQVRAKLADRHEDPRVRKEAAATLVALSGEESLDALYDVSDEPTLTTVVVRQLRVIGSPKSLPFLERLRTTHYNGFLRRECGRIIAEIEQRHKPGARGGRDPPPERAE
jgi:hypothetical protein